AKVASTTDAGPKPTVRGRTRTTVAHAEQTTAAPAASVDPQQLQRLEEAARQSQTLLQELREAQQCSLDAWQNAAGQIEEQLGLFRQEVVEVRQQLRALPEEAKGLLTQVQELRAQLPTHAQLTKAAEASQRLDQQLGQFRLEVTDTRQQLNAIPDEVG